MTLNNNTAGSLFQKPFTFTFVIIIFLALKAVIETECTISLADDYKTKYQDTSDLRVCSAIAIEEKDVTITEMIRPIKGTVTWQFVHSPDNRRHKNVFECLIDPKNSGGTLQCHNVIRVKAKPPVTYQMMVATTETSSSWSVSMKITPVSRAIHETKWILSVNGDEKASCFLKVTDECRTEAVEMREYKFQVVNHEPVRPNSFQWYMGLDMQRVMDCTIKYNKVTVNAISSAAADSNSSSSSSSVSRSIYTMSTSSLCHSERGLHWMYTATMANGSNHQQLTKSGGGAVHENDYVASLYVLYAMDGLHQTIWSWSVDKKQVMGSCFLTVIDKEEIIRNPEPSRASCDKLLTKKNTRSFALLLMMSFLLFSFLL